MEKRTLEEALIELDNQETVQDVQRQKWDIWDRIDQRLIVAPPGAKMWDTIKKYAARRRCAIKISDAIRELKEYYQLQIEWRDLHSALDYEDLSLEINPADQLSPNDPIVDGEFGPNALRVVKIKRNS